MNKTIERNNKLNSYITTVLFVVAGGIIGAATYVGFISPDTRIAMKVGMASISLVSWLIFRRNDHLRQYKDLSTSFFAISIGVLLAQFFGNIPVKLLGYPVTTVQGVAMAKFGEALLIVLPILVLHFATGGDRSGLFLGGGNRKLALGTGILGFAAFAGIGYLQTRDTGLSWNVVATSLPWILIFIFSNAFLEELWFRALFLKKLEPLVGIRTTLVITSIVFAVVHIDSTYVIDIIVFIALLLVLALLWGSLIWKSNSIWGAVFFHAGADILVILGFLAGAKI